MGEGSKKTGLFGGLLAAIGLGGLRMADNCAGAGASLVRSTDDIARAGRPAARGLDDAARVGAGLDDGARLRGVGPHPIPARGAEALGFEDLGEFAADVTLELVSSDFDADAPPPRAFTTAVKQPEVFDLLEHEDAWERLYDGENLDAAPLIFVGRAERVGPANGQAMVYKGKPIAIHKFAATCWSRGTTCIFVACEAECLQPTAEVVASIDASTTDDLDDYVAQFVGQRMSVGPTPRFIAIAGGGPERVLKLVREAH